MNRNQVDEIKARLPIEEIVGAYVKLEKAGKSWKGRCPFHNEKTPSFFVSPDRSGYYCFGCGAKGDIFTFIEQFEGIDFKGALKMLAEKAGIELVHNEKADNERDVMYAAMEEATKYYENQLAANKDALEYIGKRGIQDVTQKQFRIGYAPLAWNSLHTYLKKKGFTETIIEKVGLIKKKENSSDFYDRFRGRLMFPIGDSSGRIIAFSGRIVVDDGQSAKYINSPDTPLYDKSLVLYGLDKAKTEIRRLNYAIFVEGQMDLVMSHQSGIRNTVASSGTALGEEAISEKGVVSNLGLVRRLTPNVIIAFDSDAAGKKAAMRAANIALSLGMDVKIANIVGGKDPADLVKEDVEKWRSVLRSAKPVIEFELDNVLAEFTDDRKLSRAIIEKILPLIAVLDSSTNQSFFVQQIADRTKISSDVLWQDIKVLQKRLSANKQTPTNREGRVLTSGEMGRRIDIVERRLWGLLYVLHKEKSDAADMYQEKIKKILGEEYDVRHADAQKQMDDLVFEAETFFGQKKEQWPKVMDELLLNFEEDLIGEELVRSMQQLKIAEQKKDNDLVQELAKKCQVLSIRKAEIGEKKKPA